MAKKRNSLRICQLEQRIIDFPHPPHVLRQLVAHVFWPVDPSFEKQGNSNLSMIRFTSQSEKVGFNEESVSSFQAVLHATELLALLVCEQRSERPVTSCERQRRRKGQHCLQRID
eukprot:TRINITY_DN54334_c0_g1_i1.p2 TRINITY_DN54334_c0_g1~~TRINITY_DN54334_c0_g1_i1.p2  ORF type:complete len:115 (-),score=2.92 TRINITY_DN54334_c0_g1_i1:1-345(-)